MVGTGFGRFSGAADFFLAVFLLADFLVGFFLAADGRNAERRATPFFSVFRAIFFFLIFVRAGLLRLPAFFPFAIHTSHSRNASGALLAE